MPALSRNPLPAATSVPDTFFTEYMPQANGEFVKVYLYLLQKSKDPTGQISLTAMADFFSCTETDISRALRYWEKCGLLALTYAQGESDPSGIELLPVLTAEERLAAEKERQAKMEWEKTEAQRIACEKKAAELLASRQAGSPAKAVRENGTPSQAPIGISSSRAAELSDNLEVQELLFLTESYFARPLSSTEINRILYFYDELHFPASLVEYLVEYCVSKNHANIHYIEKVGLSWHKNGITSVEEAKKDSNTWEKEYFTILKAFGIRNRNPIPSEADYMNKWLRDYGLSLELIQEACSRTITQTGQPTFAYADKILTSWHKKKVQTLEDVKALDDAHQQKKNQPAKPEVSEKNRFNNFHQREYDYSALEKQLLNS